MKVIWSLALLLLGFELFSTSYGSKCNVTHVTHCYDSLVHYEGLGFPLYGENAMELEETCRTMNDSFECMEVYQDLCKGRPECDEECNHVIQEIEMFSLNTGLREVQKELCNAHSAIREAYLENYNCFESNANHYGVCHNDSQMSQEFMTTIQDTAIAVAARCCFFTWYHDCFTNITRDTCNENATFFVSFTIHTLIGHISRQICGPDPEVCARPPLPSFETDEESDLDNDKHNITDINGNSLDKENKSASSSLMVSIWTLCTAFFWLSTLKYVL